MNYYHLKNDVYLVKGSAKDTIYNLSDGHLYNISKKTSELISHVHQNPVNFDKLKKDEQILITILLNNGILIPESTTKEPIDICALKRKLPTTFAWIEITQQCNLQCSFCYEESGPKLCKRMSMEDFHLTVDKLKQANVKKMQYIGGEPFLLKNDLRKMIEDTREYFDFVEVFTNGTMLNQEWCSFFKKYSVNVAVSIQSYVGEEHDRIVGQSGAHKKTENAIKLLQENKIDYRLATMALASCDVGCKPKNCHYFINPKALKVTGRANLSHYDYEIFRKKAITKDTFKHPINKESIIKSVSGHQCFSKDLYIDVDLNAYPCVMERRESLGNLKTDSLESILTHHLKTLTKDHIEVCKDCEFRYACHDCRPDSNSGDFYAKPWHCSYDPYVGKWRDLKKMYDELATSKD